MPNSAPPWVSTDQFSITIGGTTVVPSPANQAAAGGVGRYTGTDTTYQTVKSWTVSVGKQGELKEVSMVTSSYTKTLFQLVIAGVTLFTDCVIQTALTLPFADLSLAAAAVVTLSAKSSDGTSITVDGSIVGKEIG